MKRSRFPHLLMVALLATWSPGTWWCCCCGAHAEEPQPPVAASTCCHEADHPASPAVDGGDDCCPLAPDRAPPCGCVHGKIEAALADAASAQAPGHAAAGSVDLLAEVPPALAALPAVGRHVSACRGSPRAAPARTLLSLGCLLTT